MTRTSAVRKGFMGGMLFLAIVSFSILSSAQFGSCSLFSGVRECRSFESGSYGHDPGVTTASNGGSTGGTSPASSAAGSSAGSSGQATLPDALVPPPEDNAT